LKQNKSLLRRFLDPDFARRSIELILDGFAVCGKRWNGGIVRYVDQVI